jgi:hypothetical protein
MYSTIATMTGRQALLRVWQVRADACGFRRVTAMVTRLSVYRNGRGELFFRLSQTHGRTGSYKVEAASATDLERWLDDNGFRPVAAAQAA